MSDDNYSAIKRYAKSDQVIQHFADIVGENKANGYIVSVITAVSASERLQQCKPVSIIRSATRAATLGLSCDPGIGQAYLVPYKNEATFQIGWKGIRDMAYATGNVANLNVDAIYEGQSWVQDQLTGKAHIEGIPKSNKPIGYFAYMKTLEGREHFEYMTVDEIHEHKKKYSPGWNRSGSAWQTSFRAMAKKTVLKRLLNQWAELTPLLAKIESAEADITGDNLPDPDTVTVTNPHEGKSQDQLLAELGFEPDDDSDSDVIDAEYTDEPEEEPEAIPTNYPGSQPEYYSIITQGYVKYVGVKDAKEILENHKGKVNKAWKEVLALSEAREQTAKEQKAAKGKGQNELF